MLIVPQKESVIVASVIPYAQPGHIYSFCAHYNPVD